MSSAETPLTAGSRDRAGAVIAVPGGGSWPPAEAEQWVRTRVAASGSSFFWAMRMLPRTRRNAMFALYAVCRAVDDVADGPEGKSEKLRVLSAWREEIGHVFQGRPSHPATVALAPAIARFGLSQEDFLAVIAGMEMDVSGGMVAPSLEQLELYCARAAGAVGRLAAPIFGLPKREGQALARALGQALQLTNVLRDLVEDADRGRLYLPGELLARHGLATRVPAEVVTEPAMARVCDDLAAWADQQYVAAERLLAACPAGARRPARVILAIYQRLLEKLKARGFAPHDIVRPVRVSRGEKLFLALRASL